LSPFSSKAGGVLSLVPRYHGNSGHRTSWARAVRHADGSRCSKFRSSVALNGTSFAGRAMRNLVRSSC